MTGPSSIRARLLTGLIVSLTLVLATGCVGLYWSQWSMLSAEFDRRLDQDAFAALRQLRPAPDADHTPALPAGLLFVASVDPATARPDRCLPADADLRPALAGLPAPSETPEYRTIRASDGRDVRVVSRRMGGPPPPGGQRGARPRSPERDPEGPSHDRPWGRPGPDERRQPPGDRVLLAGADLAPLHAALRQWVLILLGAGVLGELLVVGVVVLAVRRGLTPLRALESQIASIDQGALQRRVPTAGLPAEVRPLVGQLNDLLARLEAAFDRERAFTASAAHEFRTPLAGIRTRLEVCLRRLRNPEEYQLAIQQSLDAAISLQRMLDALLSLASLDAGITRPTRQDVDLPARIRAHWAQVEPLAAARGCSASFDLADPLGAAADPALLDHILSNLLTNAAEYADPGGRIDIGASVSGGLLRLTVANPASALHPDDVPRLFDRFWRKDASRTDVGRHCGLGLAIVSRCVEALGGHVDASLRDARLTLRIDLPA